MWLGDVSDLVPVACWVSKADGLMAEVVNRPQVGCHIRWEVSADLARVTMTSSPGHDEERIVALPTYGDVPDAMRRCVAALMAANVPDVVQALTKERDDLRAALILRGEGLAG